MSIKKKSVANFIGGIIPAIASLITVPIVLTNLGDVQYGLLTLVTSIVGYFAIIDISTTAGSVKYISEHHSKGEFKLLNQVTNFGAVLYLLIGMFGAILIHLFSDIFITKILSIPPVLLTQAKDALGVCAYAFFFSQFQIYLLSIPQALQRYDITSKSESIFGVLVSVSTMVVAINHGDIVDILYVRIILSILNCVYLSQVVFKLMPYLKITIPDKQTVKKMFSFNAYTYLSRISIISSTNSDKFIIGIIENVQSVTLFTIPSLLVKRAFSPFYRLAAVLFPLASSLAATNKIDELKVMYIKSSRYYIFLNTCLCIFLILFSKDILYHWLGSNVNNNQTLILVIIALSSFVNSMTNIPSLMTDGLGRPDVTGLTALFNALMMVLLCWLLVSLYGYVGAAIAELTISILVGGLFISYVNKNIIHLQISEALSKIYLPSFIPLVLAILFVIFCLDHPVYPILRLILSVMLVALVLATYGYFIIADKTQQKIIKLRIVSILM